MVCRVRVRIRVGDRVVEGSALLNSGFESDEPDIVIPMDLARLLDLWPPRSTATAILDTGGGETVNPYYRACAELELVLGDREPKKVKVNVIVNPYVDEVVISDYVASEFGVILLDFKKGLWRLKDDPPEKVRKSI
ncbi:MAG: hypothetical protein DRZ82_05920 [Thermoprotei archaeon]|nr:MAG: hypothetical protein DRZ82_05920 [Thermoprotei archaeon]